MFTIKKIINILIFFQDKSLPEELFGFWILNDDLLFLGNYKNFISINIPGVNFINIFRAPFSFESLFLAAFLQSHVANFITILCAHFLYKSAIGSFFYLHVTREKLLKRLSYKKGTCKMLIKLTTGDKLSLRVI